MLKERRDYVKLAPRSPYKKVRSDGADILFEEFERSPEVEMEMANAAKSAEESYKENVVAAENSAKEKAEHTKAEEMKMSNGVAPEENQANPIGAGSED